MMSSYVKTAPKRCLRCNRLFERGYTNIKEWEKRKYCSRKCYIPNLGERPTKKCILCQSEFTKDTNQGIKSWEDRKYCSQACATRQIGINNKGVVRTKENREKIRNSILGRKLGKSHRDNIRMGLRNHYDKVERKGLLNNKLRSHYRYREWRDKVYRKDNWTCQICSKRGIKLNADHFPIPFNSIVSRMTKEAKENNVDPIDYAMNYQKLWDVSNGRTLCITCHDKVPTSKGRRMKYREEMSIEAEEHVRRIIDDFVIKLDRKYAAGFFEHGGRLERKPAWEFMEEEILDLFVYWHVIKTHYDMVNSLLKKFLEEGNRDYIVEALNILEYGNPEGIPEEDH